MLYKIIIILSAIFVFARIYKYYNNKKSSLNRNRRQNKINSIKKSKIKDAEFEEIK